MLMVSFGGNGKAGEMTDQFELLEICITRSETTTSRVKGWDELLRKLGRELEAFFHQLSAGCRETFAQGTSDYQGVEVAIHTIQSVQLAMEAFQFHLCLLKGDQRKHEGMRRLAYSPTSSYTRGTLPDPPSRSSSAPRCSQSSCPPPRASPGCWC